MKSQLLNELKENSMAAFDGSSSKIRTSDLSDCSSFAHEPGVTPVVSVLCLYLSVYDVCVHHCQGVL